ncbi:MAG: Ig-like domain-containing protein [Vitreoscilla sp.]|nr:Ig-like domain-containing protein [Polaromonas sp.]
MRISLSLLRLIIPVLTVGFMATLPQISGAQQRGKAAPEITSFNIDASPPVTPGSDVDFTLEGTPRGQASVRITGVNKNIALRETSPGVYEGTYTISRRDRLGTQPTARATLRVRGIASATTQALAPAVAPVVAQPAPTPTPTPPVAALPVIERFGVTPIARIEPGAELRFNAVGTPGARALLTIDGVVRDVPMPEAQRGRYEGAYTIRRNDNFPASLTITMALEANGQVSRSKLNQALLVDARPPTVKNLAPKNNEVVTGSPISVSATFDDMGGVGVDPKTVKLTIGGVDQTRNASITPQFLTWRGDLRAGTYPVEVNASDNAGNAVKQNWTFVVATAQAAPEVLQLEVTNHANNTQVPAGTVEVRGRTAPDAKVDVQVQAIASLAGIFGINQQISSQSVRSDAAGNFAFSFQPQIPIPGARYEVTMTASRGNQSREVRLVLFQNR